MYKPSVKGLEHLLATIGEGAWVDGGRLIKCDWIRAVVDEKKLVDFTRTQNLNQTDSVVPSEEFTTAKAASSITLYPGSYILQFVYAILLMPVGVVIAYISPAVGGRKP